jgi:hypothetical protein
MNLAFTPDCPPSFNGLQSENPVDRRRLAALLPYWEAHGVKTSLFTGSPEKYDAIYFVNGASSLNKIKQLAGKRTRPAIVVGVTEDILTNHWAGSSNPLMELHEISNYHYNRRHRTIRLLKRLASTTGLYKDFQMEFLSVIRSVESVICASESQAASLRHQNPFSYATAESIPDTDFGEETSPLLTQLASIKKETAGVFILWEGTAWGLMLLESIRPQLEALHSCSKTPVRLVVTMPKTRPTPLYGLTDNERILKRHYNLPTSFIPWSQKTIGNVIKLCDIGIAPMPALNPFYAAKAHNKPAVYMKFGLPVIATNILAYRNLITHTKDGFLADTADEWLEYLSRLTTNSALRSQIGQNAKETFSRECATELVANSLLQCFERAIAIRLTRQPSVR